jgi:hypothetical protein
VRVSKVGHHPADIVDLEEVPDRPRHVLEGRATR